jgi:hypothetical protein
MDATQCSTKLIGPTVNDPSLSAALANFHPGAAHEESGLRVVSRFQRDPARIHPTHRAHVRVRQLRGAVIRRPFGEVQ